MPEEENISLDTATDNKTANLDCVPAGKAFTWTVTKGKVIEEQLKVVISRERATFSLNSFPVADMQKGIE